MEQGDSELSRMIEQELTRNQQREMDKIRQEEKAAEARAAERNDELLRTELRGMLASQMREDAREAARYLGENGVQPTFSLQMLTGTRGLFRSIDIIDSVDVWIVRQNITLREPSPPIDPDMDARNAALHRHDPNSHDVRGIAINRRGDLLKYYYAVNLYKAHDPSSPKSLENKVETMTSGRGHYELAEDGDLVPLEKISVDTPELNDRVLHNFRASLAGAVARYL